MGLVALVVAFYVLTGQKFPSKGLELSLQASVHFYEHFPSGYTSTTDDDPFCIGPNAYVDVSVYNSSY